MTLMPLTRRLLAFAVLLSFSPLGIAELEVEASGGGSASCYNIVSDLRKDWLSVKRYLLPGTENLDRVDDDHFVCVSKYSAQGAMERRSTMGGGHRCFRDTKTQIGFCCNSRISECAMLNPGLFPDAYQKPRSKKEYEAPKSDWVRPPTESDQWQSN